MIEGKQFIELVKNYFEFLITEFGFKVVEEKIRGNVFYDLKFKEGEKVISISYENMAGNLLPIIFILKKGEFPDYDDKSRTLHLNKLNSLVMSTVDKSEIILNNTHFSRYRPDNELERTLLKSAKELRLCLKHFPSLPLKSA